jgi:roadblock/LC7 domain-containing protein
MNANSDKDYIDAKVETMHTLLDERLGAFQAMMNGRFAEFQARIDGRFAEFQARIDGRFAEFHAYMDGRFAEMHAEMDKRFAEMRAEMAHNTAQIIKWMVGVWIGGIVLFITVITFVLNNAIPKVPPAAPAMQAPIIIQLPPQVWTQQPAPAPQQKP